MTLLEVENLLITTSPDGVISRVSFALEEGDVVRIMGRSGSGKTTLLRMLARLTPLAGGEMRLRGKSWRAIPPVAWRNSVAYLHQTAVLFPGSVQENLLRHFAFRSRNGQKPDLDRAAETLSRLMLRPDIMERDAATLSVGEASRVALVRALMGGPLVLLPDEVAAALDPDARNATIDLLQEWITSGRRGIVAVSHDDTVSGLLPGKEVTLGSMAKQSLPGLKTPSP